MRRLAFAGYGLAVALAFVACGGSDNNLNSGAGGAAGAATGGAAGASSGTCKNSLDCSGDLVCDPAISRCVQCVGDNDCPAGQHCGGDTCHISCVSDKECTPSGQLCVNNLCTTPGSGGVGGSSGFGGTGGVGGSSGVGGTGGVGGSSGFGGTGGVGGSSGVGGTGGVGGSSGVGGTGGSGGTTCNGPLDMMIILDHSGSMADSNKYVNAGAAVKQFTATTSGVAGGLQFMPVPATGSPPPPTCTTDADCGAYGPCLAGFNICSGSLGSDSCAPADYAKPAVGIAPLPGAGPQISTAIDGQTPNGGSTLAPALDGVITYTRGFVAGHPGHTGVVVFITDGAPNGCTGNDAAGLQAIAANGLAGTPSIKTWIVNLGDTTVDFDAIAYAGGTGQAIMVSPAAANAQQLVVGALQQAKTGSCP